MTTYKLTINLDATLAVQQENGSFNYFKPSIGAEFYTDATDDLKTLNQKFEELYVEVIGPNFKSVVEEFLINSKEDEPEGNEKSVCKCDTANSCSCKPLEIGEKTDRRFGVVNAVEDDFLADGNARGLETRELEEWE